MADDNETEIESEKHPAIRNFNRTAFQIKHVIGKILKWGAIGAVGGALFAGALGALGLVAGGWLTPVIGIAAAILSHVPIIGAAVGWMAGGIGSAALSGLLYLGAAGAVGGSLLGAVTSLSGAGEAADQEEERLIAAYERREARHERLAALEQRRDEQAAVNARMEQGTGLRPNAPMGRPRGRQEHAERTT